MKIKYFKHYKLIAVIVLGFYTLSGSAFVTVGSTNDCDFNNLKDAYNSADSIVRVQSINPLAYAADMSITKSKTFVGGYDSCADAEAGIVGNTKALWQKFNTVSAIINITGNQSGLTLVALSNFDIGFGLSTGISIGGHSTVLISNSVIHDNTAGPIGGGGIRISGDQASVWLTDTFIEDNTSNSEGGGVHCSNAGRFTMGGDSAIKQNISVENGGGIYATTDCQVTVTSGDDPTPPLEYGIIQNTGAQGGGVYLREGADMTLTGNNQHPASIVANVSSIDVSPIIIGGGGIYLDGDGTTFTGINARIDSNEAQNVAAGFAAVNQATFTMGRLDTLCWDNDKCSSLSRNFISSAAGNAGAGYVYNQANANIHQTYIANNKAENTAIVVVDLVGYLRLEGNLIVDNTSYNQPSASQLFKVQGGGGLAGNLDFYYNTLTQNNAFTTFFLSGVSSQQFVRINNSIIRDQGGIIETSGAIMPALTMDCNYVHETASLSVAQTATDIFNLDPGFVDVGNGDFHVLPGSLSKDLCDENTISSIYNGLNGFLRGYDDPNIPNLRGPFDAGAYENYDNEIIFINGFE